MSPLVPERIRGDKEKAAAFLWGYGEIHIAFAFDPFGEVLISNEAERKKLPERNRQLAVCYLWGRAKQDDDRKKKYGSGFNDFRPTPEERERIGSLDAYEYMLRLPYLMGIKPESSYRQF